MTPTDTAEFDDKRDARANPAVWYRSHHHGVHITRRNRTNPASDDDIVEGSVSYVRYCTSHYGEKKERGGHDPTV